MMMLSWVWYSLSVPPLTMSAATPIEPNEHGDDTAHAKDANDAGDADTSDDADAFDDAGAQFYSLSGPPLTMSAATPR